MIKHNDEVNSDIKARNCALDISNSFIMQAPAGSGKTFLLVQRYLKCLIQTQQPERILAITFTKKASVEMKERILAALSSQPPPIPQELATQILASPQCLKVLTIDSLCHQIASTQPEISPLPPDVTLSDHAIDLYRLAAERLLLDNQKSKNIQTLINIQHGHVDRIIRMLTELLSTRDQWIQLMAQHSNDLVHALNLSLFPIY